MNKIYLIKNLSPWMINELLAFSQFVQFRLVLLRKPSSFYEQDLEELKKRGIEIFIKPFKKNPNLKKNLFSILFIMQNIHCFLGIKNFAFGIKAICWFIFLDEEVIPENSSIHAQFATQASIIALLYKKYLKNVEYYFTFHAYDIYYQNRWFSLLVNESKAGFSISDFNIDYVANMYKYANKEKIILSRLGVFLPESNGVEKQETFTTGFLSWWEEKKGIFILLQALDNLVKDQKIRIKFILAGDGPMREKAIKFIREKALISYIDDREKIFGKDKEKFYRDIDVLVLPSIYSKNDMDGIPVVLMEAISYGVPIISTDISGIPEICKDNYNGFLIPPSDASALSKAILEFYNMKKKRFQEFKRNACESSKVYNIVLNSQSKLKKLGWN